MRIKNRFLITSRNELEIRKVYEIAGVKFPLKRGVQQHDTNEKKIYEIAGEQFLLDPPSHLYILDLFSDTPEYKNLMTYLEEKGIDFHKTEDEVLRNRSFGMRRSFAWFPMHTAEVIHSQYMEEKKKTI